MPARATRSITPWTTAPHWKQLQNGLPAAPVSWIVVQKQAHDVVVSTYGRGLYIMEDITPLEQGVLEPSHTGPVTLVDAAARLAPGARRPRAA